MTLLLPPGFVKFGTRGDVADIIHVHNSGAFSAQVCLSGLALESDVGQHNALELLHANNCQPRRLSHFAIISSLLLTTSRPVANNSPNSFSCVTFSKKLNLCTTSCLLGVTWTPWIDSAIQKHLNYHRQEPKDLEDCLFHTVFLLLPPLDPDSKLNFFRLLITKTVQLDPAHPIRLR